MPDLARSVKREPGPGAAMLLTLQMYVFRELIRTFLFTAIALTVVLSTCGGAYNLTRIDYITPKETLLLLGLVVPLCAAFTLPIAALFSATMVYGRLSADIEFVACRSSGINIHVLLLPCVAVSLISAVTTFLIFNFVIPWFMGGIGEITRSSVQAFIVNQLEQGRTLDFQGNVYIRAGKVLQVPGEELGPEAQDAVLVGDVTFIQMSKDEIVRFGTGESAAVRFDRAGPPTVEAELAGIKIYELVGDKRMVPDFPRQRLGPYEIPLRALRLRPSVMSLTKLLESVKRPEEVFDKVEESLVRTRRLLLGRLTADALQQGLIGGGPLALGDGRAVVQAGGDAQIALEDPHEKVEKLRMSVSNVNVTWLADKHEIRYRADLATFELSFPEGRDPQLLIQLSGHVTALGRQADVPTKSVDLGPIAPPQEAWARYNSAEFANERLWDKKTRLDLGPEFNAQCKKLRKERVKIIHDIVAEINVRTVYSASVLVLAVLGACLAIIYRGGQMLVAFGVGFVPAIVVVLFNILGKALAKGESGLEIGLGIMWGSLLVVAALTAVVLFRYLPR